MCPQPGGALAFSAKAERRQRKRQLQSNEVKRCSCRDSACWARCRQAAPSKDEGAALSRACARWQRFARETIERGAVEAVGGAGEYAEKMLLLGADARYAFQRRFVAAEVWRAWLRESG